MRRSFLPALAVMAAGLAPQSALASIDHFDLDDDEPTSVSGVRAGAGGLRMGNLDGAAPSFEVGCDVAPWGERLGLRFTFGTAMRSGWGAVGYLAPDLVYYPLGGRPGSWSPYLALGVQFGFVSITPWERSTTGTAALSAALGSDAGTPPEPVLRPGPSPLRLTVGPQATAGVRFALGRAGVEVGGRMALVHFEGSFYPSFALIVTLVGPPTF